jgi:hypothetical protein
MEIGDQLFNGGTDENGFVTLSDELVQPGQLVTVYFVDIFG